MVTTILKNEGGLQTHRFYTNWDKDGQCNSELHDDLLAKEREKEMREFVQCAELEHMHGQGKSTPPNGAMKIQHRTTFRITNCVDLDNKHRQRGPECILTKRIKYVSLIFWDGQKDQRPAKQHDEAIHEVHCWVPRVHWRKTAAGLCPGERWCFDRTTRHDNVWWLRNRARMEECVKATGASVSENNYASTGTAGTLRRLMTSGSSWNRWIPKHFGNRKSKQWIMAAGSPPLNWTIEHQ